MVKRSSSEYAWIGGTDPPFEGLVCSDSCNAEEVSAVLVSSEMDPLSAANSVRECFGEGTPWLVYAQLDDFDEWIGAGASGFIPTGASEGYVYAAMEAIARLSRRATTRNPLSGLPGNVTISQRLRSQVIEGGCKAAYFDISGFKPFNDYYGFSRGDAVLRSLALILTEQLSSHFVGHIGGDDFVAVGRGDDFLASVREVTRIFNGRAGGFYSGRDHSAGGIEALDRNGEFRFYPIMDLTVSIVDGSDCSNIDDLARKAGLEKKRQKGEMMPDTVAGFLAGDPVPSLADLRKWIEDSDADTVQIKALLESAGILGDTAMIPCLSDVLKTEEDYHIRKSAARALGNMAMQDSSSILKEASADENAHVRTAATMALPFVLGREAGPLLMDAVKDSNTWVRRAALRGLGVSGWEGAASILRTEIERGGEGRYWLNHRQELTAALEGASFLGDSGLSDSVVGVLRNNPGVSKRIIWKTLLTLGGETCYREMIRTFRKGVCNDCIENLDSLEPVSFSISQQKELELLFITLKIRRRSDRIKLMRFLGRLDVEPSLEAAEWFLGRTSATDDSHEFHVLLETLMARGITPRREDMDMILEKISSDRLKLSRESTVSLLRWTSTGSCSISSTFLEKLLRHESREVRTAAARAVISLARRHSADE